MLDAKADCEALMNAAEPLVEQLLTEHGEFFPFGVVMTDFDECTMVGGYDGREQPPSTEVIALIKQGFVRRARRGQLKATALVYDVRVVVPATGEKSDAVAFALDHRNNYSVVVFIPYKLEAGAPVFAEAFAQKGEGDIFRRHARPWWAIVLSLRNSRLATIVGIVILICVVGVIANIR